ncbi:hypothetical protein BLOT_002509 [Blomia tropicalis]|nr:hypothetical protein BLOT_002509 [Blomia tropicalis]
MEHDSILSYLKLWAHKRQIIQIGYENDYDENDGLYLPNNYRWWYIEELNQKKNDLFDVVFK